MVPTVQQGGQGNSGIRRASVRTGARNDACTHLTIDDVGKQPAELPCRLGMAL